MSGGFFGNRKTAAGHDKVREYGHHNETGELLSLVETPDGMWYVNSPMFTTDPHNDVDAAKTDGAVALAEAYSLPDVPKILWQPCYNNIMAQLDINEHEGTTEHMALGPDEEALNLQINSLTRKLDNGQIDKDHGMVEMKKLVDQRNNLRKVMDSGFIDKVSSEMHELLASGLSSIDTREALSKKYGSDIASKVCDE